MARHLAFLLLSFMSVSASAGIDGVGTHLVFPVVVSTPSYTSQVYLLNVDAAPVNVSITYYGAGVTSSPGPRSCGTLSIGTGVTLAFDFKTICSSLGAGGHFGLLRVESSGLVSGYSRVSNPQGNGFSVEAFRSGEFSGQDLDVLGLKKSSLGPGYSSNCFVASLDEPAQYSIRLFNTTGAQLGSPVNGSVGANELVRHLDIFGAAGITGAEHADFRARIAASGSDKPALIAFCTVQNNENFDADFRIGKTQAEIGVDVARRVSNLNASPFVRASTHRFALILSSPDTLKCEIDATARDLLEMRLLGLDGRRKSGGAGLPAFEYVTGPKNNQGTGRDGVWTIEIRPRPNVTQFPITYSLSCDTHNYVSIPLQLADTGITDWAEATEPTGTLINGVRLLSFQEQGLIIEETDTTVTAAAALQLNVGDVFITSIRPYKVLARMDSGSLAILTVGEPSIGEVFKSLRIDGNVASLASPLKGLTVTKTDDAISANFDLTGDSLSVSADYEIKVLRVAPYVDFSVEDGLRSAELKIDANVSSTVSVSYTSGENGLDFYLTTLRFPVPVSVFDPITNLFLGRTAVSIVVPFYFVAEGKVSLTAQAAAKASAILTYSSANGADVDVAQEGGLELVDAFTVSGATPGVTWSVVGSIKMRPALGFFEPVALLGADVRAGIGGAAKITPTLNQTPPYCLSVQGFYRRSIAGFFSTIGKEVETPTYAPPDKNIGRPFRVGSCDVPECPGPLAATLFYTLYPKQVTLKAGNTYSLQSIMCYEPPLLGSTSDDLFYYGGLIGLDPTQLSNGLNLAPGHVLQPDETAPAFVGWKVQNFDVYGSCISTCNGVSWGSVSLSIPKTHPSGTISVFVNHGAQWWQPCSDPTSTVCYNGQFSGGTTFQWEVEATPQQTFRLEH